MVERPPRVFISYRQESERPEHQDRVLALADRLIEWGIETDLDQYEQNPPEGWATWCKRQIQAADYVLIVCTPAYLRTMEGQDAPGNGHGVLWETRLIRQLLYDAGALSDKFVPVLFSGGSAADIPIELKRASHYMVDQEDGWERLYRQLTGQPKVRRPQLGKLRPLPERQRKWREQPVAEEGTEPRAGDGESNTSPADQHDQMPAAAAASIESAERMAYLDELEKFVQAELGRAPDALAALAAAAGYDAEERLTPTSLSHVLLHETDIGKTVSALRKAHDALRTAQAASDQQAALVRIINRTIPAIVLPEAVDAIRRLRHEPGEAVISLPAFQLTVAEFLMSGADRRPVAFDASSRRKQQDWPRGSFYLSDRLECGPEDSATHYEQAVRKLLEAEYGDTHTLRMLRHDPAGRVEHIRDNLHEMAETRYFVCEGDCEGRESAYRNLKHAFQYIVFLQLKPDKDLRKREHELFYNILDLLAPLATEKK